MSLQPSQGANTKQTVISPPKDRPQSKVPMYALPIAARSRDELHQTSEGFLGTRGSTEDGTILCSQPSPSTSRKLISKATMDLRKLSES